MAGLPSHYQTYLAQLLSQANKPPILSDAQAGVELASNLGEAYFANRNEKKRRDNLANAIAGSSLPADMKATLSQLSASDPDVARETLAKALSGQVEANQPISKVQQAQMDESNRRFDLGQVEQAGQGVDQAFAQSSQNMFNMNRESANRVFQAGQNAADRDSRASQQAFTANENALNRKNSQDVANIRANQAAKPPPVTEYQRKVQGLVQVAQQALPTIDALENAATGYAGAANAVGSRITGGMMASDAYKGLQQAGNQFVQSYLYSVSGAQAPEAEVARWEKVLITQPGDTPPIVAQKKKAREAAMSAMQNSATAGAPPAQPQQQGAAPAAGLSTDDLVAKWLR